MVREPFVTMVRESKRDREEHYRASARAPRVCGVLVACASMACVCVLPGGRRSSCATWAHGSIVGIRGRPGTGPLEGRVRGERCTRTGGACTSRYGNNAGPWRGARPAPHTIRDPYRRPYGRERRSPCESLLHVQGAYVYTIVVYPLKNSVIDRM